MYTMQKKRHLVLPALKARVCEHLVCYSQQGTHNMLLRCCHSVCLLLAPCADCSTSGIKLTPRLSCAMHVLTVAPYVYAAMHEPWQECCTTRLVVLCKLEHSMAAVQRPQAWEGLHSQELVYVARHVDHETVETRSCWNLFRAVHAWLTDKWMNKWLCQQMNKSMNSQTNDGWWID